MTKTKTSYACKTCNHISIRWLGCCPECNEWDTFRQSQPTAAQTLGAQRIDKGHPASLQQLHTIHAEKIDRMRSNISEWDRVLGGGIMPGSFLILTGDPGIGKSTLLLQVCNQLAINHLVCYFSTEESLHQVKQRADRLQCTADKLFFSDNANFTSIITAAEQKNPAIMIIDSIQNCYIPGSQSLPGSIGQLREVAFHLMRFAKEQNIAVIVTGHITKEGTVAGPKTLEHVVDGVFYLQGEDRWQTRILRAVKNRFGTINELGFFEMHTQGLQPVNNINAHLLDDVSNQPGSALVSIIEGSRPLMLELQALTIQSKLAMPQWVISGLDHKQVVLIAAILEKYLRIKLSLHDIFFKVSGGFKIKGSSVDIGIALALLSSYFKQPIHEKTILLGEISLTGQIKPINQINLFVREAEKFHIKQLFVAKNQKIEKTNCIIKRFHHVYELLSLFNLEK